MAQTARLHVIAVVDYGMGNLGSILSMLKYLGAEATSSNDPKTLLEASRLILPGVGAFDEGINRLQQFDLIPTLHQLANEKRIPILGICLGLQLMTLTSEEGSLPGLGWFEAHTASFGTDCPRVPHIGWNQATFRTGSVYSQGEGPSRFYFLHSYRVEHNSAKESETLATTVHENCTFVSALRRENLIGVQFHPEKSHTCGKSLFRTFLENA